MMTCIKRVVDTDSNGTQKIESHFLPLPSSSHTAKDDSHREKSAKATDTQKAHNYFCSFNTLWRGTPRDEFEINVLIIALKEAVVTNLISDASAWVDIREDWICSGHKRDEQNAKKKKELIMRAHVNGKFLIQLWPTEKYYILFRNFTFPVDTLTPTHKCMSVVAIGLGWIEVLL